MKARENPFRTGRLLEVRYRLQDTTWPALLARLEGLHYRGALVGAHGSGKTTLLEDLQPRLRERGFGTRFIRLDQEHRSFAPASLQELFASLGSRDIVLFDGAEQMSFLAWRRFRWRARRAGGLIITTHSPGRLPTLHECRTSTGLLAGIVADLLEEERSLIEPEASVLFRKHRGNLREALRECYDRMVAFGPCARE